MRFQRAEPYRPAMLSRSSRRTWALGFTTAPAADRLPYRYGMPDDAADTRLKSTFLQPARRRYGAEAWMPPSAKAPPRVSRTRSPTASANRAHKPVTRA